MYTINADRSLDLQVDADMLTTGTGVPATWKAIWADTNGTMSGTPSAPMVGVASVSFPIPASDMSWIATLTVTCFPSTAPGKNDQIRINFSGTGQNPVITPGAQPNGNPTLDALVSPEADVMFFFP